MLFPKYREVYLKEAVSTTALNIRTKISGRELTRD